MNINEMNADQIEERLAQIRTEIDAPEADLDALQAELTEIESRKAELAAAEETRRNIAENIAAGRVGAVIESHNGGAPVIEKRNTPEYLHAFRLYMETGSDAECRALLTENVESGTVPVPEIAEHAIRTAWDSDPITSRCRKSFIKGNLKIGYEDATYTTPAGSDASVHVEGSAKVAEETLKLEIVEMVPSTIKKWISISDEVLDLDDGSFIEYIYSELTYKIVKKLSDLVVSKLLAQTSAGAKGNPAGYVMETGTASTADIIEAEAYLGGEATNPVLIMTAQTKSAIKSAAIAANYGYDPFDGMEAIAHKGAEGHILLVDLNSVQINFPAGEDIEFKFDDVTLADSDLVRIIGRLPAAPYVTAALQCVNLPIA